MKWEQYHLTVRNDRSELFDFLIMDPPYGTQKSQSPSAKNSLNYIRDEDKNKIATFARKNVALGGWVFSHPSSALHISENACLKLSSLALSIYIQL